MSDHPTAALEAARALAKNLPTSERAPFMREIAAIFEGKASEARAQADMQRGRDLLFDLYGNIQPQTEGAIPMADTNTPPADDAARQEYLRNAVVSDRTVEDWRKVLENPDTPIAWKRMIWNVASQQLGAINQLHRLRVVAPPSEVNPWGQK